MRSDIDRRLSKLEARLKKAVTHFVTLMCNHGEDVDLLEAHWRAEHPNEPDPETFVFFTVFSAPPRLNLATRDSVLDALPNAKAFFAQCPSAEDELQWRNAAELAGVSYDDVVPVRAGDELIGPARRPYQPPQAREGSAQINDLDGAATPHTPIPTHARAPRARKGVTND